MSTTIKRYHKENYTKPYFSGNVEFLDISNSFNQLRNERAARTSIKISLGEYGKKLT
jgi:predicted nuclease of restriction endonuclease-like (RecB) superfamily